MDEKKIVSCEKCGSTEDIQYHHPKPRVFGGIETIPLCGKCHSNVHNSSNVDTSNLTKIGILKAKVYNFLDNCFYTKIKPSNEWEMNIAPQLKIPDMTKRQVIHYLRKLYKIDAIVILTKVSKNDIKIIESDWKSKNFVNV